MCNRATPNEMMKYKLALALFKLYNKDFNSIEFVNLNFNQVITGRQSTFKTLKTHNKRVGLNSLANRFNYIDDLIPLKWLNLAMICLKCSARQYF